MAEHTAAQKRFIVLRLATFDTPRDIAEAFRIRFPDTACSEDDVLAVDPRVTPLPPDLAEAFDAERRRVLGPDVELAEVAPFAEQRARLIRLSRQAARYEANNQPAEARAVYRQIAEEQGVIGAGKGGAAAAKPDEKPSGGDIVTITRTIVYPDGAQPRHSDPAGVPPAPVSETV